MADFQSKYKEALMSLEQLQGHFHDMLIECCEGNSFGAIQASFRLIEEHYKETNRICNDLQLWHAGRTEGRRLLEWTEREIQENILFRSTLKAISGIMCPAQDVYRVWLHKDQLNQKM